VSCTLRDVAQLAGVSTATVSRVMNGAENVSSHTRSKVLSAISRLKYSPDVHAVELGRGKRGIPRKRGTDRLSPARTGTELHSDPGAHTQNQRRKARRLCLLEEENARLKRLVTNLSTDVEMWRSIAQ
jgi:transcriptional regulator with XRE-family HTH domain